MQLQLGGTVYEEPYCRYQTVQCPSSKLEAEGGAIKPLQERTAENKLPALAFQVVVEFIKICSASKAFSGYRNNIVLNSRV